MSEAFIGEIRIFAGNFAPRGWALCNGQLMPVNQNTALFSILGPTYGGDGRTTFGLPNLQGRAPMGVGGGPGLSARTLGQNGGSTTVTLLTNQMPVHTHAPMADGNADTGVVDDPSNSVWASGGRGKNPFYSADAGRVPMHPKALGPVGGTMPHNNMQPFLGLTFIIALEGVYPVRG